MGPSRNLRTFILSLVLAGKSDSSPLVTGVSLVLTRGANEPVCGVGQGQQQARALRDLRPRPGLLSSGSRRPGFAPCSVKGTGMNPEAETGDPNKDCHYTSGQKGKCFEEK